MLLAARQNWWGSGGDLPYDEELEYIITSGDVNGNVNYSQHIDTGVVFKMGCYAEFTWANNTAQNQWLNLENKGWGASKNGNSINITGAGRASYGYIQPWINSNDRSFTPNIRISSIVVGEKFTDVCSLYNNYIHYTSHRKSTGITHSISNLYCSSSFSTYNIFLGKDNSSAYPFAGAKRMYGFRYKEDYTAEVFDIDLIPVLLNGNACMYDKVNGIFKMQGGRGKFGYCKKNGVIIPAQRY